MIGPEDLPREMPFDEGGQASVENSLCFLRRADGDECIVVDGERESGFVPDQ